MDKFYYHNLFFLFLRILTLYIYKSGKYCRGFARKLKKKSSIHMRKEIPVLRNIYFLMSQIIQVIYTLTSNINNKLPLINYLLQNS